ncbi:MAG: sigma-70 family RNA polymerase sigma factor [Planctomycetota bacterium]
MNASAADLLLKHEHLIRSLARDLLNDDHTVDDVVQQTWLAAIQRSPRVSEALGGWLAIIARNFALRSLRASTRRRAHEERGAPREAVPSTATILQREETRRQVVSAVLALAEPERAVTVLRYFEGLPPRAIARRLAISADTVHNRLKRARAELRLALTRHHGDQRLLSRMLVPLAGATSTPWSTWLGTASLMGGLLVMTTKVKLGIVAALVLGVGTEVVLWHLRERTDTERGPAGAESRATRDVVEMPGRGAAPASTAGQEEAGERALVDAKPAAKHESAVLDTVRRCARGGRATSLPPKASSSTSRSVAHPRQLSRDADQGHRRRWHGSVCRAVAR